MLKNNKKRDNVKVIRDALTTLVKKTSPALILVFKSTASILKDFFEYNFSEKHGGSVLHAAEFLIALVEGVVNTVVRFFKLVFIKLPKVYIEAFNGFCVNTFSSYKFLRVSLGLKAFTPVCLFAISNVLVLFFVFLSPTWTQSCIEFDAVGAIAYSPASYFGAEVISSVHSIYSDFGFKPGSVDYYSDVAKADPGFARARSVLYTYMEKIQLGLNTGTLPFIFVFLLKACSGPAELTLYYLDWFQVVSQLFFLDPRHNMVRDFDSLFNRFNASAGGREDRVRVANEALQLWANWPSLVPEQTCHVCSQYHDYLLLADQYETKLATHPGAPERARELNQLSQILYQCLEADAHFKVVTNYTKYFVPDPIFRRLSPSMLLKIHTGVHDFIEGHIPPEGLWSILLEEAYLNRRS